MDAQLLQQADTVLSRCGRPLAHPGAAAVCLYRGIPVQTIFSAAPASSTQTITREIPGETTFVLRAISTGSQAAIQATLRVWVQIQLPNGRFLLSDLADMTTIGGQGSFRYALREPVECPPGTKVTVTYMDRIPNLASAQPAIVLLEGVDRYLVRSNRRGRDVLASDLPRYAVSDNQNILAPCWMRGEGPETPDGSRDTDFTYVSDVVSIPVAAAVPVGQAQIAIDTRMDFLARRLMFVQMADAGVGAPGIVMGKLRDYSGYALMDDYLDLLGLLNGAPMPGKDWHIQAGGKVFADLQLVGATGQGNVYFAFALRGVNREKT